MCFVAVKETYELSHLYTCGYNNQPLIGTPLILSSLQRCTLVRGRIKANHTCSTLCQIILSLLERCLLARVFFKRGTTVNTLHMDISLDRSRPGGM